MTEVERSRVPVACPNDKCGVVGWIPINRLDRQLVCRQCGTRFYMDSSGSQMKLGERPTVLIDPLKIEPPPQIKPNVFEKLDAWWNRLPRQGKSAVKLGSAGVVVAAVGVYSLIVYLTPVPKVPKDLRSLSAYVTKGLAENDSGRIKLVSDPKTVGDLSAWMKKVRPPTWPRKFLPKASIQIRTQSAKTGQANVSVVIEPPGGAPKPPPPKPAPPPASPGETVEAAEAAEETPEVEAPKNVELNLRWVMKDGVWLLNLTDTLKYTR